MAKITKSDLAPKDASHFSFGAVEFDLSTPKASFETTDPVVIAGASAHPWLSVEQEAPAPSDAPAAAADPLDPHTNPAADHLSALGSPEAVAAAATNEAAIRTASGLTLDQATGAAALDNPTTAESVQATLDNVNSDATAALPPEADAAPVEATEPGGGRAPDAVPTPDPEAAAKVAAEAATSTDKKGS